MTTSGSGLDPNISPDAAYFQVSTHCEGAQHVRKIPFAELVAEHIEGRTLGLFGEPRVNVLELNLALDSTGTQ